MGVVVRCPQKFSHMGKVIKAVDQKYSYTDLKRNYINDENFNHCQIAVKKMKTGMSKV